MFFPYHAVAGRVDIDGYIQGEVSVSLRLDVTSRLRDLNPNGTWPSKHVLLIFICLSICLRLTVNITLVKERKGKEMIMHNTSQGRS